MAETNNQQQQQAAATQSGGGTQGSSDPKPKMTMGRPQAASLGEITKSAEQSSGATAPEKPTTHTTTVEQKEGDQGQQQQQTTTSTATTVDDDAVKKYLAEKGINVDSIDDLKNKITAPAAADAPPKTKEQLEKEAKDRDLRILNAYVAQGGKPEDYYNLKRLVSTPVEELSDQELRHELKELKFTDDEIKILIKERYYQLSDEEIEQLPDETDKEFAKRKREYGKKKLSTRSAHVLTHAKNLLGEVEDIVKQQELQEQTEVAYASKVDAHLKALPRKMTFELGDDAAGQKINPIETEVTDADLAPITELLKSPEKRKQYFFNEDGTPKIENVTQLLLHNQIMKTALKNSYLAGATKEVKTVHSVFGSKASEVGLTNPTSTAGQGQKGKFASKGKVEVATPAQS